MSPWDRRSQQKRHRSLTEDVLFTLAAEAGAVRAAARRRGLGFVAGLGTTFAGLPDLIAMFRRGSSAGMNPRMVAILGVFQIVWGSTTGC